ncbi:hypothetical protein ALC60_13995 [Trachymyrmex zeteki]|uniref:Uncharacterized protein n=1 Tax=Mycetomoellerius zeteki TaxID=64791 RepID=A0A151WGK4_9HYME|nr:hypothetical protein ALC60_13995 [Trachymyrmex zeteki]
METNQARLERRLKRSTATAAASLLLTSTTNESIIDQSPEINSVKINIGTLEDNENEINNEYQNTENNEEVEIELFIRKSILAPSFKDVEVQVNVTDIQKPKFCNSITTDSELSTATGIESFQVLNFKNSCLCQR